MITHDALEAYAGDENIVIIEVNGVNLRFTMLYDSFGKHPMWESEDKKLRCLCSTEEYGYSGYLCADVDSDSEYLGGASIKKDIRTFPEYIKECKNLLESIEMLHCPECDKNVCNIIEHSTEKVRRIWDIDGDNNRYLLSKSVVEEYENTFECPACGKQQGCFEEFLTKVVTQWR